MITFPNAKINIGLNILNKRADNYHNIESLFLPIPLKDALEIVPSSSLQFSSSGIPIDCDEESNLVLKAYRLLEKDYHLPPVKIHLHKHIPFGAGLGGGSADAAFTLNMLNAMFELGLGAELLERYAAQLGADCAFFVKNEAALARGIGDELTVLDFKLTGWHLLLVKPDIHVSTPEAYRYVQPQMPDIPLVEVLKSPVEQWEGNVKNDFEASVFKTQAALAEIKNELYNLGASYAAMSGSGSSIFGLFREKPMHSAIFASHFVFYTPL